MKWLNLLSSNLRTGFLDNGKGEKIEYLKVPDSLTIKELEEDVNNGAVFLEEILKGAKKRLSRVIIINTNNTECGLMAVNYLAGICNGLVSEKCGFVEDDIESNISEEENINFTDEFQDVEFDEFNDIENEDEPMVSWTESKHRLPVIDYEELESYDNKGMEPFFNNNFISAGKTNNSNKTPYWVSCTKEAVCIYAGGICSRYNFYRTLNASIQRFVRNKRVFIIINDCYDYDLEMNYFEEPQLNDNSDFLDFVLNHTADVFSVKVNEKDLKKYRLIQFENWVKHEGFKLAKKVPKKEIVEQIVSFRNPEKSALMKKILNYIRKESEKDYGDELTKEDFEILKKFSTLSQKEEKNKKSNAKKLEEELVGMDVVKERVKNIIDVMKYNKLRAEMGLDNICFHNTHLLIGAPGTAKTTVARFMGEMMFEEKLLPDNRFISVNGADLKGRYVGHSAPKTHKLIECYDVILIDEAYSLASSGSDGDIDSFSQEAIAQLILEIEAHPMDKLILLAGYGGTNVSDKNNKMKAFIDSNPGLKSRINSTIYFESYTAEEMVEIVHTLAKNQKLELDNTADSSIYEYFNTRVNDDNFGNGREARSLLENAMMFAAKRIMQISNTKRTKKMMNEITGDDVINAISKMQESDRAQKGRTREKIGFLSNVN